jgi:hypothetical protein
MSLGGALALRPARLGAYRNIACSSGKKILKISGKISNTNGDSIAAFDRAMLEALGMVALETTTPWFTGKVRF